MTNLDKTNTKAWRFFWLVTARPKLMISISILLILLTASFIPTLNKDTRSDAFIPSDHPSLLFREETVKTFGLKDPMVIAVINEGEQGVFNPNTLALVDWISHQVENIDNVNIDRITSLSTENDIIGTEDGMLVEPFFETPPVDQQGADNVREAVMDFPLYLGSLVARDGTGTLIVIELNDQFKAQPSYLDLMEMIKQAPIHDNEKIHVAGEGAVAGYMGAYIDADAMRLNPIAALVITIICFVAFRTLRGALIPNLVVVATVGTSLGLMAAFGVSFFVITNALPVVLIGISVADSIHILSQYYEEVAEKPDDDPRAITVRTMVHMWRPITLTSVTTMAGFLGLSLASIMPPMKFFGLFALIGVGVAWAFSLLIVPAVLTLLKPKASTAYILQGKQAKADSFGQLLGFLGRVVVKFPRQLLFLAVVIAMVGSYGASKLVVDETLINTFHHNEPIVIADTTLNKTFDGTHYLDIMIETPQAEDLYKPENLKRIVDFQRYMETLPHVGGSTSIVDYLKQMNRALHEDQASEYQLPKNANLIAQYFLLYSTSGNPDDFQEEIDYDYRLANLRVRLDSGQFTHGKTVVEAAQKYIDKQFNTNEISARLSGRVNVDYHWIKRLGESHFVSVGISLLLVFLMAAFAFRSFTAGLVTIVPVIVTILAIYAFLGFTGTWLSISSSMFAAIAIGLGVDFSIHTVERLQSLVRDHKLAINDAIMRLYPSTGRALLFNFLALSLGFGVLTVSKVVTLQEFGSVVAMAITISFLSSMTILPALIKVLKPQFIGFKKNRASQTITPNPPQNTNQGESHESI